MQCISFDEQFQRYTEQWAAENAAHYRNNYDAMEEKMPEVYMRWLNTPADWLNGATPGAFFSQYSDAGMLIDWLRAYFVNRVPVPEQLLERIVDLGGTAQAPLYALLTGADTPGEAVLTAISLLVELQSALPMDLYITWVAERQTQDERADMAAEALVAMGRAVVPGVLAAVPHATPSGQETFTDVLCNFPGEEQIYALALSMFLNRPCNRALYASLLGKLGDARALPALLAVMDAPALNYLDYIELRNAIEALGGDPPPERSFDGDPYYESLRRME